MTKEGAIENLIHAIRWNDMPMKEALDMAIEALGQELKTEKTFKMCNITLEEREIINKYIKSISKPTGVNFWDLYKEPCEDCISR